MCSCLWVASAAYFEPCGLASLIEGLTGRMKGLPVLVAPEYQLEMLDVGLKAFQTRSGAERESS